MATSNEELKNEIYCPLTKKVFCEPVVALSGTTYEKEAIEDWMECSSMEKSLGNSYEKTILTPNLYLKSVISNLTLKQPELLKEMYIPRSWKESFSHLLRIGNLSELRSLLDKQPSLIDTPLEDGKRALHLAAEQGNREVLNFVLSYLVKHKRPLEKDCKEPKQKFPSLTKMLKEKIENEEEDALEILVEHGADIDEKDEQSKESLLHSAAKMGNLKQVAAILKNQAEIDAVDQEGNTPLHLAILGKRVEVAQILIESGASKIIKNKEGNIPLFLAILIQDRDITALFLGKETARLPWLYLAYKYGGPDLLECMLKKDWQLGSEINFQGNMPLYFFVVEEIHEAVEILMKHKIDPLQTCGLEKKTNPLCLAAKYGDLRMVKILLAGADRERLFELKHCPLHIAVKEGNTEIIKFLVEQGFYIKSRDEQGKSPVEIARDMNRDDLVSLLKETAFTFTRRRINRLEQELMEERERNKELERRLQNIETYLSLK